MGIVDTVKVLAEVPTLLTLKKGMAPRSLDEKDCFGAQVQRNAEAFGDRPAILFEGKEINVLTGSDGMPPAEVLVRTARIFTLGEHDDFEIPIADPFDLLANKLAVRREKDLPHIDVLRRFVESEVIHAFQAETHPRARLASIRRLLDVLGLKLLPFDLADRLIPLAAEPVDFRFLMGRVPTREQALLLLERIENETSRREAETILAARKFDR